MIAGFARVFPQFRKARRTRATQPDGDWKQAWPLTLSAVCRLEDMTGGWPLCEWWPKFAFNLPPHRMDETASKMHFNLHIHS